MTKEIDDDRSINVCASLGIARSGAVHRRRVAIGRMHGAVEVYDDGALRWARQLFRAEDGWASRLAFSTDAKKLAVWGVSGTLYVWSLEEDGFVEHGQHGSGGDGMLLFAGDGSVALFAAGAAPSRRTNADGMVELSFDRPTTTLAVRLEGRALTTVEVDGAWQPLSGNASGVMTLDSGDGQRVEAWSFTEGGLARRAIHGDPRGRLEALSPSERLALVRTPEGYELIERGGGGRHPLPDLFWSDDILGFLDDDRLVAYQRGVMVFDATGSRTRLGTAPAQSAAFASSDVGCLERSGHERDIFTPLDGSSGQVLATVSSTTAHVCAGDEFAVVSFTSGGSGEAAGVFVHTPRSTVRLPDTVTPVMSIAVSGDGQVIVGVFHDGTVRRWSREGRLLGEGALFAVEAERGCLSPLTLNQTGTRAVERNLVSRCFDLERFTEAGRFALQKKRGDPPVDDATADRKARRRMEAAWDAFIALRTGPFEAIETLSPGGDRLAVLRRGKVVIVPLDEAQKKESRRAPALANTVCLSDTHVAFTTPEGGALHALSSVREAHAWRRSLGGRVAACDGRWMVLAERDTLEVCDARTGQTRWRAAVPSNSEPTTWDVGLHADGARIVLRAGGSVVVLSERGVTLQLVVLEGGEHLAVGPEGYWASPGAFERGYVTRGGRAARSHEDAAALLGPPCGSRFPMGGQLDEAGRSCGRRRGGAALSMKMRGRRGQGQL